MRFRVTVFVALVAVAASAAPVVVPRIVYRHRTLANGLQVYSIEDHSAPTVAIDVWYHVGSKNDPPGRSGFAHLFEHMMFKATAHMKSEEMDRLTEDVGGYNNASTEDDATFYYEDIPSNYLQDLLWAEADRMSTLKVDEANFKSERAVVEEEFRTRVLADPYGLFEYDIDKDSFAVHPYKRPTIGSIKDLEAATLPEVQKFHSTYYRPDNATLVVAGDFDPKQLDAWIDEYFGPIPRPETPIPRVTVKEPPRKADKTIVEHGPNVPLPAVAITWLAPPATSSDRYALELAASILAQGDSSRLYQSLVYRQQIAQDVDGEADLREQAGLFIVGATVAGGKSVDAVEKALRAELHSIESKPVSAAELEKAKNQIVTGQLRRRETNDGKAFALAYDATVLHDAAAVNNDLPRLEAVTAADVQRVMDKYVRDGKSVTIVYESQSK